MRQRWFRWFLVLAWMGLIFGMSTDLGSAQHTSRFLGPLLHWLLPGASPETILTAHGVVRKCGHLTEYAILALLVWWALRGAGDSSAVAPPWCWRTAAIAFFWATFYAASDEYHQSFVGTRGASPVDVAIDSCGAALGLLLAWWRCRAPARRAG